MTKIKHLFYYITTLFYIDLYQIPGTSKCRLIIEHGSAKHQFVDKCSKLEDPKFRKKIVKKVIYG